MSDDLISSIHNYCDRWCEKCPFAERCVVGLETFINDKNPTMDFEDVAKSLSESFEKVKSLLDTEFEKLGLDPKEVEEEAKKELPKLEKRREKANKHPLYESCLNYSTTTHKFLSSTYYKDENPMSNEISEVFEIINWYHSLIPAKANRVCFSLFEDEFEVDPIQNDKNGTAKLLDICIKNSMAGWHKLMELQPEFEDDCLQSLVALNKLLLLNKATSPDFMQFIRPGFDEVE